MTRKQYLLTILLALVTGLIGGVLSNHIIQPVFAEKAVKPQKLIVAEEFILVDKNGDMIAEWHGRFDGKATLRMYYDYGKSTTIREDGIFMYGDECSLEIGTTVFDMWKPYCRLKIESEPAGPHISLFQNGKLRSTLGCTELVTKKAGTKITRSPASLVLFDEKGSVIWSTPQ